MPRYTDGLLHRCPKARESSALTTIALLRLIITVMKVPRFTLAQIRLPEEAPKRRVFVSVRAPQLHKTLV